MVKTKVGTHSVEMYDAIDELPIVRFHKYQKMLLLDAGIGADIAAFDKRLETARRFLMAGKNDDAEKELQNLRQCVFFIQNEISPSLRAFAALVKSIDGKEYTDISEAGIDKIMKALEELPYGKVAKRLAEFKKKIDSELEVYFPALFDASEVKEYYDILRKRTLEILMGIARGDENPGASPVVEKITTELYTYAHPKEFAGSEGAEVQFDRQFENLCLALSAQLHIAPKECTVLEFYNAFDYLQDKARREERAAKEARRKR